MRPPALAALALSGCLLANPAFDGDGATGTTHATGTTSTTAAPTTTAAGSTDMSAATGTTEAASAGESTGGTTGAPPTGPTLCGAPFDPAAIQPGVALDPLNSPSYDLDMWLSTDGLTLYFSSGREDPGGDSYRAIRPARDQPFGAPINSADIGLSTADGDLKVALTEDGLFAAISIFNPDARIVFATRDSPNASFGPRTLLPLTDPNATDFVDPHLSLIGDRLYAATLLGDDQTLVGWRLPDPATALPLDPDPFAAINALPGSASDPSLSSDERVLLFGHRPDGQDNVDLWYATRDDRDAAFGAPAPLAVLNTDGDDASPHISADGCEIFFSRDPSKSYVYDLYRAAVAP